MGRSSDPEKMVESECNSTGNAKQAAVRAGIEDSAWAASSKPQITDEGIEKKRQGTYNR
jgi:hypothetical protein